MDSLTDKPMGFVRLKLRFTGLQMSCKKKKKYYNRKNKSEVELNVYLFCLIHSSFIILNLSEWYYDFPAELVLFYNYIHHVF